MIEAIQCKYSCDLCDLNRVIVTVPARLDESVTEWMDATIVRICADHTARSPNCHPKTLKELLIPVEDKQKGIQSDKIGGVLR